MTPPTATRHPGRVLGIREAPARRLAVVRTLGDPRIVGPSALRALYGTVERVQRAPERAPFPLEALRARYPDPAGTSAELRRTVWALPLPDDVAVVPQFDVEHPVAIEVWVYGTVAEAVHLGGPGSIGETEAALRAAVTRAGYRLAGAREEEYPTGPRGRRQTIIRYPVQPTGGGEDR